MKHKKYWLIGGAIGALAGVVYLLTIWLKIIHFNGVNPGWFFYPLVNASLLVFWYWQGDADPTSVTYLILYTLVFLEFFIPGIILGWMYGQIKEKFKFNA